MPTIKIEGTGEQFEQTESQDCILRAGLTAGYGLAYECNSGGCGTCKFQLIEGEIEEPWPTAPALSARDIKKGRKLACQCKAKTDLVIKMRTDPEYAPINLPARFEATLSSRRDVTSDIVEFCFQAPDSSDAKFLPGQYAMLTFPDGRGPRAYSMSNLPNGDGVWEFWIRRKPGGKSAVRFSMSSGLGVGLSSMDHTATPICALKVKGIFCVSLVVPAFRLCCPSREAC